MRGRPGARRRARCRRSAPPIITPARRGSTSRATTTRRTTSIERNLAAGRAGKVAYIDDAGRVHLRRARGAGESLRQRADGARRAARGARAALPPRHHRLPDGVPRRDQGGHRARSPRTRCSRPRDYEYMLCDSRARALVVSAALLPTIAPVIADASRAASRDRHRCAGEGEAGAAHCARGAAECRADVVRAGRDDPRRHVLLALFVGLDRHAQGHGARAFEPDSDRGAVREAGARAYARTTWCSPPRSSSSRTVSAMR